MDYSATTKPDEKVLDTFLDVSKNNYANPNSKYSISFDAKKIIDAATSKIADYLGVKEAEIIYTSGASESNNMAIKGLLNDSRRHIITTPFEHSSITAPLGYLQSLGYKISFVKIDDNGLVSLTDLEELINDDTLLVSIGAVNSELGFRQPIEEIGKLLKKYNVYFHSDITQCLGKDLIDLTNVDLASFSAHKIYGIKGIGGLVKKSNIKLLPLIHGGKSTTIYRSGTPQTELIASTAKAFELIMDNVKENKKYVQELNDMIRDHLKKYEDIVINSTIASLPHILNVSFIGRESDDTQAYFAKKGIFFSTKTACASDNKLSNSVLALTKDESRASSSVRISLSFKTTKAEIKELLKGIDEYENN